MTRAFPTGVVEAGNALTAVAGSYLRTVTVGNWDACVTCALPVNGYMRCPQCQRHHDSGLPVADRAGFLVYADKPGSQAYRTMFGYKEERLRASFEPIVRGLLTVGLRAHFACAMKLSGSASRGWAVVPSTKGRDVFARLVHALARDVDSEVSVRFTGAAPGRELHPAAWEIPVERPLPEHVVVIDDSWVTGASSQSLAIALHDAGVAHVSILSVARVLSPEWTPNPPFIRTVLPGLAYDWRTCPWTRGECP